MGLPIVLKFLLDYGLTLVSIHVLEVPALLGDCLALKVTIAVGKVFWFEALGAILGVHGVDESGLFVVAEIG
jgi:hypothetical protein